ncbi:alpha/beta hydrolase [Streptomycetaceae bacterium NBC_01309]
MPNTVTWEPAAIPAGDRELPARVYRPVPTRASAGDYRSPAPSVIVWAHGGSWRSGSVAEWHPALAHLASLTGATVVGVDYRLAPENPHPAPLVDVLAALDWADELAGGAPVAVGGDSAGATLAASAALVRRDAGRPLAAQLLAYPPIDPACRAASYGRDPGAFPRRADLAAAWRAYRGGGANSGTAHRSTAHRSTAHQNTPYSSSTPYYSTPADAADVTGVAPAALVVGTLDPVADDVRAYAARLAAADVPVVLHELPGVGHGAFLGSPEFRRRLAAAYRATRHAYTLDRSTR